jgi:hypothetical protein
VVQNALRETYGHYWGNVPKRDLRRVRRDAIKPIKARMEFFEHIAVYVMINLMLWMIFIFSSDMVEAMFTDSDMPAEMFGFPWPLIVMGAWGIGLIANGVEAFNLQRKQSNLDRDIAREREALYASGMMDKPKNDFAFDDVNSMTTAGEIRLNADGELTDSIVREYTRKGDDQRRSV